MKKEFILSQEPNTNFVTINGIKHVPAEPKEETFTITKEQIDCLSKKNEVIHELMREWFPKALIEDEKKLVIGKWYWFENTLFNYQLEWNVYGFNKDGNWCKAQNWKWLIETGFEREATPEEVFEALKAEAVKRGFKDGAYVDAIYGKGILKLVSGKSKYYSDDNSFFTNGYIVFKDGKWAEIIPTMTKTEAEQKLNCKII